MAHVQGVYAAAITPRGKQGDVDFAATFELLDLLAKGGVAGIALFTGAGEYTALTVDERSRLVYLAVKRSRVPVLVGVGSATLDQSLALAREARDAGATGLLLPPPYYYRHNQDDLHEFYTQFAAHLGDGLPTYLAHAPAYVSSIEPATAGALIARAGFAGIEDASGDPRTLACLQSVVRHDADILAGNDGFLADAIRAGAHAAISPAASAVPELVADLESAVRSGAAEAPRFEQRMREFLEWCAEFPEPAILKVAVEMRGIKTGGHSVPISAARGKRLEEFREWFPGWLKG
jgi:dihydrodipicolinate synthase/N-acetylneuraminate lyase